MLEEERSALESIKDKYEFIQIDSPSPEFDAKIYELDVQIKLIDFKLKDAKERCRYANLYHEAAKDNHSRWLSGDYKKGKKK